MILVEKEYLQHDEQSNTIVYMSKGKVLTPSSHVFLFM